MRIGMIAGHACIRVQKMAIPLVRKGHTVHLVSQKIPVFQEIYKTHHLCMNLEQIRDSVEMLAPHVDIFHAHNEPSWFVNLVKERCDIPVILDVHDSYLARSTPEEAIDKRDQGQECIRETTEERNNFQNADALVFPGVAFREIVVNEFKLDQPSLILPSYVPKEMYRYMTGNWLGGLVYEGKVVLPEHAEHGFHYCEYSDLAEQCGKKGMDFHIYGGKNAEDRYYEVYKENAYLHKPLVFSDLIKAISRHDWGLVGNVHPSTEWDVAFPNKMFEYMAANVPIVAMNARACGEFVERTGVGISVSSIDELASRWKEHRICRERLMKIRLRFSMEEHISGLENLYSEICKRSGGNHA